MKKIDRATSIIVSKSNVSLVRLTIEGRNGVYFCLQSGPTSQNSLLWILRNVRDWDDEDFEIVLVYGGFSDA